MFEQLKKRWNVKNGLDVIIILAVFACTGFTILYLKRLLFDFIHITDDTATWVKWFVNIIIILPLYQLVLLIWGWIWGKFYFFFEFEKRMWRRIKSLWSKE